MLRLVLIFAIAAAVLQACIIVPIPPVWDDENSLHRLREIEVGVTTKEEVLDIMGRPQTTDPRKFRSAGMWSLQVSPPHLPHDNESGTDIVYHGEVDRMMFCFAWTNLYNAVGGNCVIDSDAWLATIYFDDNGVVTSVETAEGDLY
jgi:hypothetical protein